MKTRVFCLHTSDIKKAIVNCTLPFFTNTNLLKMTARWLTSMTAKYDKWMEDYKKTALDDLDYEDYGRWLKDLKKTPEYRILVAKYKHSLEMMHEKLVAFFNNELMLSSEDEKIMPILKIDASQRDNYIRQFRAWLAMLKDTCPDQEIYFGPTYDRKHSAGYERFFFKHHWDPEKTVDESLMKTLLGSEWDKDYKFDYNVI